MSSEVLEFFRQTDERFRQVPDADLSRFIAESHPEFLQDEGFKQSLDQFARADKSAALRTELAAVRREQTGALGSRTMEKVADFAGTYVLQPIANIPATVLNLPAMAAKGVGLAPEEAPLPFEAGKPIVELPRVGEMGEGGLVDKLAAGVRAAFTAGGMPAGGTIEAEQIARGAVNALAGVAESITTPENLAALPAATIKAGTSVVRPAAEMTFAGLIGSQVPAAAAAAGEASVTGTTQEKAEAYTGLAALSALTAAPVLPAIKQARTRQIEAVAPETARALEQVQPELKPAAAAPEVKPVEAPKPAEVAPVAAPEPVPAVEPAPPTAPPPAPKTLAELAVMDLEKAAEAKPAELTATEKVTPPVTEVTPDVTGIQIQRAIDQARRSEGGFIDPVVFQSIVDFGKKLLKPGMKFAEWSAAMVKSIGPRVREFLEDAWDSIRGVLSSYDPESGAYVANRTRRKIMQVVRGPSGALPKSIRQVQELTSGRRQEVEQRSAILARDIKGAFEEAYKRPEREAALTLLDDVMSGRQPLSALPTTKLMDAVRIGRYYIDTLSGFATASPAVSPALKEVIELNRGKYWRRQYMAFDPEANWTYDAIVQRMKRGDAEAGRRFNNMRDLLKREHPDWTDGQIEAQMRSIVDRAQDLTTGRGGEATTREWAANVSSLMRRNDLPVEVRDWLGEIRDPFAKMTLTGKWMAQFLSRQDAMQEIAQIGLDTGLFSKEKTGRYSEQLYPDELDLRMVKDDTGTPMTTEEKQIIAEFFTRTDKAHHPLRNLYTTKQMADALKEFEGREANLPTTISALGQLWFGMVSLMKKGQVPLNPGSWLVNVIGGAAMNAVAGHWNGKLYKSAFLAVALGNKTKGGTIYNAAEKISPGAFKKAREEYMMAVKQGLTDAGVLQSEIRELTESVLRGESGMKAWERVQENLKAGKIPNPKDLVVAAWKMTDLPGEWFISKPDNMMRLANFLGNLELSKRAFPDMEPNARLAWATERARNTYQTYSKLPQTIRDLSKLGILNTYIQFKAELIRNTFWVARYAMQDLASGNPALIANGVKAIAGLATVTAGAAYLSGLSRGLSDITPDQEEALRLFLPPWDRNELLFHVKREGNTLSYSPFSYLIPYSELVKIYRAAQTSLTDPEKAERELVSLASDYFGPSSLAKPAIEAIAGTRIDTGDKITGKEGLAGAEDRFNYFFANTLVPRMYYFGRDLQRGLRGIPGDYGKVNNPEDAFYKLAAVRIRNLDLDRAVFFKLREMEDRWQAARSEELKAERRWKDFPDKVAEVKAYTEPKKAEVLRDYAKHAAAAKLLGVSEETIRKAERDLRIPLELRRTRFAAEPE